MAAGAKGNRQVILSKMKKGKSDAASSAAPGSAPRRMMDAGEPRMLIEISGTWGRRDA